MRKASEEKEKEKRKKKRGEGEPPLAESEYYESSTRDECKPFVD